MPTTALEDAHEVSTESAPDGSQQQPREVRYPFAFKNLDWDEYHRYRPEYPDALFDVWLEYHRRHGGGFECLHDVGAGRLSIFSALSFSFLLVSSFSSFCDFDLKPTVSITIPRKKSYN